MFRLSYRNYIPDECDEPSEIESTDDFLCQECTRWSGLSAIDVLAAVLDMSEEERRDLRSWHERHFAPYRILSANNKVVRALNVINDQQYVVRMNMKKNPFRAGMLAFGSLVPWKGEWYWSGQQQIFNRATQPMIDDAKKSMIRKTPQVVCRYWKEYEQRARDSMKIHHAASLEYHGDDLVLYPDGLTMAADLQKELREQLETKPQDQVKALAEKHGLKNGRPNISLPDDLVEVTNGVGVFLNPVEGKELMGGFDVLVEGLRRKGVGLTEHEREAIRAFISGDAIGPRFVERMVAEYGDESIKATYLLPDDSPDCRLEYLLRCHKGHFFRTRYPALSVV